MHANASWLDSGCIKDEDFNKLCLPCQYYQNRFDRPSITLGSYVICLTLNPPLSIFHAVYETQVNVFMLLLSCTDEL